MWRCVCDCGIEIHASTSQLTSGDLRSCGCLARENVAAARDYIQYAGGTCVSIIRSDRAYKGCASGIRGVMQRSDSGKWQARITFAGKTYSLGCYDTAEEAIKARKTGEEKIFGDFLAWYETIKH